MNNDWTDIEVELIVADYFSMLYDELNGIPINKTEHRKKLGTLIKRSEASIEFKHRNITAELINLGMPFIKGYKPLYNSQKAKIVGRIQEVVSTNPIITTAFDKFSKAPNSNPIMPRFESWLVEKPKLNDALVKEPKAFYRRAVKINYLEREQKNRELGMRGEELVLEFERWSLINAGKHNLAETVEWVSIDQGDGLGFDILSRNLNGSDKYIEVKTTKLSRETPFFFTSNELQFSIEKANNFHLYRVFDINNDPRMFDLSGPYDKFCNVEATQYRGWF